MILTLYYYCYPQSANWNGYGYDYYNYICGAGAYNPNIPGAPTSVPLDVAIRDEGSRPKQVFRFVDANFNCPELNRGPLCRGSGIRPNTTDGPPSMLGDGPCEQPFLEWQVVAPAAMARNALDSA